MPILGAANAAPNKGTTILYWFQSLSTVLSPTEHSIIQGFFKAFEWFSSTFQGDFYFQGFSRSPLNSSTFQACANPGYLLSTDERVIRLRKCPGWSESLLCAHSLCWFCHVMARISWAATCDFQHCGILTSVDSDEPVQPPSKLRNSKWSLISS